MRFGILLALLAPAQAFSLITDPHVKWRVDGFPKVQALQMEEGTLFVLCKGASFGLDLETGKKISINKKPKAAPPDETVPPAFRLPGMKNPKYAVASPSGNPLILVYENEIKAVIPLPGAPLRMVWSAAFSGSVSAPPAAGDKMVFVPTKEGSLLAFDLEEGKRRWEYFIGVPLPFRPEVTEDAVYVAGANDFLYGVNFHGRELWRHQCGPLAASPVYKDGVLYAANEGGTLYAFTEHQGDQDLEEAVKGSEREGGLEVPRQSRVTNFLVKREIKRLAEQLSSKDFRPTESGRVVAVLMMKDLKTPGGGLDETFTDMLIEAFTDLPQYTVVERTRLGKIMEEQKLGLTGAFDAKAALKLGRLVAANRMVTGSVAQVGDYYELNARLTETETGILIKTASVQVRKDLMK